HAKGMKVCLDLVAGHTSDKHPWFVQSTQADTNLQYSDYYIWTKSRKDKPKKYISIDAPREGNYMKNFFDCQPALNYGYAKPNPNHPWEESVNAPGPQAVRRELKNIIAFWMDKGVDGFRVDMASSLIKNDPGHIETTKLWREVSTWFRQRYPEGVFISEWGTPHESIPGGFNIDFMFHFGTPGYTDLVYNKNKNKDINCFFGVEGEGKVERFINSYQKERNATKGLGYITLPTSNHDIWRLACGKRTDPKELKVAMTFFMTMPGVPFIYYGDEIGMKFIENLPNVEGSLLSSRNRAGSRSPMQWDQSANAGFSVAPANKLYIPIDSDKNYPNVASQEKDPNSLLNYVKGLIQLRKSSAALSNNGEWKLVSDPTKPYPLVYIREAAGERYCIALNPSGRKVEAEFTTLGSKKPEMVVGQKKQATYSSGREIDKIKMNPISAVVFKLK
ncbi:MAG: alpha-amylase family glycosyl hydrolase, partial [Bacteroidaceae bacterium]